MIILFKFSPLLTSVEKSVVVVWTTLERTFQLCLYVGLHNRSACYLCSETLVVVSTILVGNSYFFA